MEACRKLIARVADRDHKMYARYNERFRPSSRTSAPRLRSECRYKAAIAAIQPTCARFQGSIACALPRETSARTAAAKA